MIGKILELVLHEREIPNEMLLNIISNQESVIKHY